MPEFQRRLVFSLLIISVLFSFAHAAGESRFILEKIWSRDIPSLHVPALHLNRNSSFLLDLGPGMFYKVNSSSEQKGALPQGRFIASSLSSEGVLLLEPGFRIFKYNPDSGIAEKLIERTQDASNLPYAVTFGHDEWLYVLNRDTGKTWVFTPDFMLRYQFRLPISGRSVKLLPAKEGFAVFDVTRGIIRLYSHEGVMTNELSGTDGISACTVTPSGEILAAGPGYVCRWDSTGRVLKGYPQKLALSAPSAVSADGSSSLILDRNGPVLIRVKAGMPPAYSDLSTMLDEGGALLCPGRGLAVVVDYKTLSAVAVDSQSSLIRRYNVISSDNDGSILIRDGLGNSFAGRNGGEAPMLLRGRLMEAEVLSEIINKSNRYSSFASRADETLCYITSDMKLRVDTLQNSRKIQMNFEVVSRGGSASQPVAIQELPGGRIAVLDRYNRQLIVYGSQDRVEWQAGVGQDSDGDGRMDAGSPPNLTDPVALAANIDGFLFVLDRGISSILAYDTRGRLARSFRIPSSSISFSMSYLGYVWLINDTGKILYLFDDFGNPLSRFKADKFGDKIVAFDAWGTELCLLVSSGTSLKLHRIKAVDRIARARYLFDRGRYSDAAVDIDVLQNSSDVENRILAIRILSALGRSNDAVSILESLQGKPVSDAQSVVLEALKKQVYNH